MHGTQSRCAQQQRPAPPSHHAAYVVSTFAPTVAPDNSFSAMVLESFVVELACTQLLDDSVCSANGNCTYDDSRTPPCHSTGALQSSDAFQRSQLCPGSLAEEVVLCSWVRAAHTGVLNRLAALYSAECARCCSRSPATKCLPLPPPAIRRIRPRAPRWASTARGQMQMAASLPPSWP